VEQFLDYWQLTQVEKVTSCCNSCNNDQKKLKQIIESLKAIRKAEPDFDRLTSNGGYDSD
jgi:hypothetical protein